MEDFCAYLPLDPPLDLFTYLWIDLPLLLWLGLAGWPRCASGQ